MEDKYSRLRRARRDASDVLSQLTSGSAAVFLRGFGSVLFGIRSDNPYNGTYCRVSGVSAAEAPKLWEQGREWAESWAARENAKEGEKASKNQS